MHDAVTRMLQTAIPRNWKSILAENGIHNLTRQDLWDLQNPTFVFCSCGNKNLVRQTNVGRLTSCGGEECAIRARADKISKTKATCLVKYGETSAAKTAASKEKTKATTLAKYGVPHHLQVVEVKEKRNQTNMAKYGCHTPAQSSSLREQALAKKRSASRDNFVTEKFPLKKQRVLDHHQVEILSDWVSAKTALHLRHVTCGTEWCASMTDNIPRCPTCGNSREQNEIEFFLRSITDKPYLRNDRKAIAPYEIDILFPALKLGIEVNGAYWHRDGAGLGLAGKSKLAAAVGIRLIHVMDWSWNESREIICSNLTHAVAATPKQFNARSCKVTTISSAEARKFLTTSHISGFVRAKHHFGIFNDGNLIGVMSLEKPRWGNEDLEIIRWATLLHTNLRGGFSKVLKHAISALRPKTIVSFCDLMSGSGSVYANAGFTLTRVTPPNYVWIKGKSRLRRYKTQKHRLSALLGAAFDSTLSEAENMSRAGWFKVSDCGNQRWVLNIPGTSIYRRLLDAC